MKKDLTELVFILDKSGSMHGLEADTIGGFNSLIEKQKKSEGECLVTVILFSDKSETVYDRIKLSEIKEMTDKDYSVGGCTALIDAIGEAVKDTEKIQKHAREEDRPAHTMFIITTDGMENASRKYDSAEVKKMIEKHKSEDGWEFLFIGANIDSVETAGRFGIDAERAVNYRADKKGTAVLYGAIAKTVECFRKNKPVSNDWSAEISEDYKNRK